MGASSTSLRNCLREPIPEIVEAAEMLEQAVSAHLVGDSETAARLIRLAYMPLIREWTESVWGGSSQYVQYRAQSDAPPHLPKDKRVAARMPSKDEKRSLHMRDGFHCRFCGMALVRNEVRQRISKAYPDALQWGRTHATQHAAFQAMWVQYDHVLPHARGGTNDIDNLVIACAAGNFGRMNYTLAEVGIADPRLREPTRSSWTRKRVPVHTVGG